MAPPKYGDLGKSSRDVFGKGYHFGLMKLEVKTKTNNGVEFNSSATNNSDSGKVSGDLETKYKFKEYGVTLTEKWNTDNNISATIDVEDQLLKGLRLTFDSSFSPATGQKSGGFVEGLSTRGGIKIFVPTRRASFSPRVQLFPLFRQSQG